MISWRTPLILLLLTAVISCKSPKVIPGVDFDLYARSIEEHRAKYLSDFIKDPRSPLDSTDLDNVRFFEPNIKYRCACSYRKLDKPSPFKMSTYAGTLQDYIVIGIANCAIDGQSFELELYQSIKMLRMPMYRNQYFVPFKDHTNGETSYGGGRYIDLKLDSVVNNVIEIDFNKAYNPWCAYSDGFACPIPPVANHLALTIAAGEATYDKSSNVEHD